VFPVAGVVPVAKQSGAHVVIMNGVATDMDRVADVALHGQLGALLPRVVAEAKS
jgi:NAD-dependent SIR2 family protein deacetylase